MLRKLLVVFTLAIQLSGLAYSSPAVAGYTELLRYYPSDSTQSDFIIMIDVSGSMKTYWKEVQSALVQFVMSLPDRDYVSIWGFDSATRELVLPRITSNVSRSNLAGELASAPEPDGSYTDLFCAVDKVLDLIAKRSANQLKFAIFFTDFVNSPPPGSKWATSIAHLNEKYKSLIGSGGKSLSVHAIQLPLSPKAGRHFNTFSGIFNKNVLRFMFDANSLKDWYMSKKQDIIQYKLSLAIADNFRKAFAIKSIDVEKDAFRVKLMNRLKLPATVEAASITAMEYGISSTKFDGLTIKPGEDFELSIPFNDNLKDIGSFFSAEQNIEVEKLQLTFAPQFREQLSLMDISSPATWESAFDKPLTFTTGFSILFVFIPLLLLGAYIVFRLLRKKPPEPKPEPLPEEPVVEAFTSEKYRVTMKLNSELLSLKKDIFEIDTRVIISRESLRNDDPKLTDFAIYITPASPDRFPEKPKNGLFITYEAYPPFKATYTKNDVIIKEPMIKGKDIFAEPVVFDREYKMNATYMNKFRNDNSLEITIALMD